MSYAPINIPAYVAAYSGAIAGMAVSGWISDPLSADYATVTQVAGAFAQSFDTVWNSATALNNLEIAAISAIVGQEFASRGPGPLANSRFSTAANWTVAASACAALVLQSDAYFAGQGINPGTGGGGGVTSFKTRTGAVVPVSGDYTSTLITNLSTVAGATVTAALNTLKAASGVVSFNTRTGAVVPADGDYLASQVTNNSSVAGATVRDALDALAAAAPMAPLEIVEDKTLGDWETVSAATFFAHSNGTPTPIECQFAVWVPGDILRVTYCAYGEVGTNGDPLSMITYAAVSLDAGGTWQLLSPTGASSFYPAGELTRARGDLSGSASIALATAPIVRIGLRNLDSTRILNNTTQGAFLRCERYSPNASYTPAGTLIATP